MMTYAPLDQIDRIIDSERRAASSADEDVLRAVDQARGNLERIAEAVANGRRPPTTVTGDPFFSSTARDLVRTLHERESAYRTVRMLTALRDRLAGQAGGET